MMVNIEPFFYLSMPKSFMANVIDLSVDVSSALSSFSFSSIIFFSTLMSSPSTPLSASPKRYGDSSISPGVSPET